ncbi:hypothetical protein [Engelhardtia mirabilis]|uniref:Uncharacterized protein n=1 Tax=Engelhardtia mirabilis TaxID=2528011 RepID=A0A518BN57_9BACT|nr:hypothetical protein Pla133_34690 [Planctomycetes bacterium Pla133]QDV02698.1 hypothetical protein Pla86_34670 [Planctomycetes bacterium Pla86]
MAQVLGIVLVAAFKRAEWADWFVSPIAIGILFGSLPTLVLGLCLSFAGSRTGRPDATKDGLAVAALPVLALLLFVNGHLIPSAWLAT